VESKEIISRLAELAPSDEIKIQFMATFLGCSAELSVWIAEKYLNDFTKIPYSIGYCIALTSNNMLALDSGSSEVGPDLAKMPNIPKDKLIYVLKQLIKHYKDELID
jgi:hypothetical protein